MGPLWVLIIFRESQPFLTFFCAFDFPDNSRSIQDTRKVGSRVGAGPLWRLLCKQEPLYLVPGTHEEKPSMISPACYLSAEDVETGGTLRLADKPA